MLGLYPTWLETGVGSGWIVAFIATIHVLFSHASVGGAILFGFLANYGVRHNKPVYLEFIKKYGLFLLIFSYVLGSITGPGIWFSATVAAPRGISALIHSFVWVWATEWVFFIIEVIGIYLLVYLAGKVDTKTHTRLTVIFTLASVATLLIIVGVLSFMLWPGNPSWSIEGGVTNAFFGPNTLAQALTRLAFVLSITAVVAGMVAARIKSPEDKASITRILSATGIVGMILGYAAYRWYMQTLPANAEELMVLLVPEHLSQLLFITTILGVIYFAVTAVKPQILKTWLAFLMTLLVLAGGLAPEEIVRERIRKPWIAGEYLYANQIIGKDVPALGIKNELSLIAEKGVLKTHPFIPDNLRNITPENEVQVGQVLAMTLCSNCHSLSDKGIRPLPEYFKNSDKAAIEAYLGAALYRGHISYMPAIPLPKEEREALAAYLAKISESKEAKNE